MATKPKLKPVARKLKERKIARMTLRGADLTHPAVRRDVVTWLRKLADNFEAKPAEYGKNFGASFTYLR